MKIEIFENEKFLEDYYNLLSEEFDKEFEEMTSELEESYGFTGRALNLVENYFEAYNKVEALNEFDVTVGGGKSEADAAKQDKEVKAAVKGANELDNSDVLKAVMNSFKNTSDLVNLVKNSGFLNPRMDASMSYDPDTMFVSIKKISEMKFPENVIFFIKQLISWIKNLVVAFISKISNLIRRLIGLKEIDDKDKYDLKLRLAKATKIENSTGLKALKSDSKGRINVYTVNTKDVNELSAFNALAEGQLLEADDDNKEEYDKKNSKVYMFKIDVSNELEDLKQLVNHFFNIFDASYGSNGEFLFGTQDLELMLKIFSKSLSDIMDGKTPEFEVQGTVTDIVALDKDRLRVNLEKTLINTEKLKKVYSQILNKIQILLKLITNKQLIAATDMGTSFKFYSAATYQVMDRIIQTINPRIKEAELLEKKLAKMKKLYEDMTKKFAALQQTFSAISGASYQTAQQKTISNMFEAAKVTTQTITLRLTTLSLYLKTIKDVKESIHVANAVNESSKNAFKNAFGFLK